MIVWFRTLPGVRMICVCRFRSCAVLMKQGSTVDEAEINRHNKLADKWWNEDGEMKALHSLNRLRVKLIGTCLRNENRLSYQKSKGTEPFKGIKMLEVGCGGGILTEPLARLGADVTGLDASLEMISTARAHAAKDLTISTRLCYILGTIEEHVNVNINTYDVILASEVLEHVTEKELFINSCVKSLKPGGSFFITTINKTILSWLGAIFAAEKMLKLVPQGTHDWNKFLKPRDLEIMLDQSGCDTRLVHGMLYNVMNNTWQWVSSTNINYATHAVKRIPSKQLYN